MSYNTPTRNASISLSSAAIMKEYGGIYFVTTKDFGLGHVECAQAALTGGVKIIQYREKEADIRTMIDEAQKIKELCKAYGALFIIDDRVDLALAVDSDGVHLGQEDMPLQVARKIFPNKVIGVSAKTEKQAFEAERDGATYLGVGAIFPTNTKVKTKVIGMEGLKAVRKSTSLPIYGIGGLNIEHIKELKEAGADGMAVVTAIAAADDRVAAASDLTTAWNRA